jgi:hypothetical protein
METYDCTLNPETDGAVNAPSVDFINAVSEFLDTDPTDLLRELGYYHQTSVADNSVLTGSASDR